MATGLENLKIYKLSCRLEIFVHRVLERKFPREEKYRSVDQLKRSSASITNNIAESYGKYSYGMKINHLYIARGEIEETRSGFARACQKGFVSREISGFTIDKYEELLKLVNGYIRFLKNKN